MVEHLGPNLARAVMGNAYNPEYRYGLETDFDGFTVIVTNPETGETSSVQLSVEEPSKERLTPIWKVDTAIPTRKRDVLGRILFWLCIAVAVSIAVIVRLEV